ncbi:carboxylesterase/lipase family protein [Agrobacterium sp. MCAB5]|uniref:carboxylesterase/lipase family protein n=1 Tax=Agrobacterium sp. MCAB5 TaxID=3233042 RepID=UPI003F928C4B
MDSTGTTRAASAAGTTPMVGTTGGQVSGYTTGRVNVFKGVPYGRDTAASRFEGAVPAAAWDAPLVAQAVGDPCYQKNRDWKGWTDNRDGSENCLFLNVWSPNDAKGKPVMVFFHGGGYRYGTGGAPLYDGERLAVRGDVVVVTVNHRLHVLGFTFLGDLLPDSDYAPNPGLLDLVAALHWVRLNISAFGGDPQNVTIFGESGGGGKVSCLMAMPSAKGLFHRAIVQSGAQRKLRSREQATKDTVALLEALDLGHKDAGKLADIPVDMLYTAYRKVVGNLSVRGALSGPFSPVLDGEVLPWHPSDPQAFDNCSVVTKMYGANAHESAYYLDFAGLLSHPVTDEDMLRDAVSYLNLDPSELADFSLLISDYKTRLPDIGLDRLKVGLLSDLWMASDTLKQSLAAASQASSAPVYHYVFAWEEPYQGDFWSLHGAELLFTFDNVDADEMWGESGAPAARANRDPSGYRYLLRDNVVSAWASFAKTGQPSLKDGTAWPAFDPKTLNTMVLGEGCEVQQDYFGNATRRIFDRIEAGVGS